MDEPNLDLRRRCHPPCLFDIRHQLQRQLCRSRDVREIRYCRLHSSNLLHFDYTLARDRNTCQTGQVLLLHDGDSSLIDVIECPLGVLDPQQEERFLLKRSLQKVELPSETYYYTFGFETDRRGDGHFLIGQASRQLFPRELVWESADKKAGLRRSAIHSEDVRFSDDRG